MIKRYKFFSLLLSCFPFVREYRLRKKIRMKKLKMCRKRSKEDPKHLRRYVLISRSIRRL